MASNQQGTPQDISDLQNKQQDLEQKLNKGTENIDQIQKSLTDVLSKVSALIRLMFHNFSWLLLFFCSLVN